MLRKALIFSSLVAVVCGVGPALLGQPLTFPLEGSQEVPPVVTDRSGSCIGQVNASGDNFDITCSHDAQDVVTAHIHRGRTGENGSIVFSFMAGTTLQGAVNEASLQQQRDDGLPVNVTDFGEFVGELNSGNLYVNVHSPANPGGEIRGQIPIHTPVAHFGNGGSNGGPSGGVLITSDLVFVNPATTGDPANATVFFYGEDGNPIDPVDLVGGSSSTPGNGGGADGGLHFSIDPLGDITISTSGEGPLVTGSAVVFSDGILGVVIRFNIPLVGVAGVGASVPTTGAIIPARRQEGGINTAAAIRNSAGEPIMVNCKLRSDGVDLAEVDVPLDTNARVALFINEVFPEADTSDFVGSMVCTSEGLFAAIALEFDAANGIFTTLPVMPLR